MTTTTSSSFRPYFWPLPLHAAALVVPLLLIALGTAIDRTGGGERTVEAYLNRVADAPGAYLASGLLLVAGMAGLVATAAALIRMSFGLRRVALVRVGAIMIGLWGVCAVAGVSLGYTAGWVALDARDDLPGAVLIRVFEGITYSPWGLIGGGIGGAAYVVGIVATGIGLILARGVPTWTGIVVLLSPLATFTGGPLGLPLVSALGFVVAAIGLAGAIPVLLRSSSSIQTTDASGRQVAGPVGATSVPLS